jgi:two-component system, chemotaxis family, chemotaxis protein CheY
MSSSPSIRLPLFRSPRPLVRHPCEHAVIRPHAVSSQPLSISAFSRERASRENNSDQRSESGPNSCAYTCHISGQKTTPHQPAFEGGHLWAYAIVLLGVTVGDMDEGKNGGLSILVVDDDDDMRTLIRTMLTRMNANILVIEVRSGEEALERLSAALEPFNIVICDWEMPGMSGLDLYKKVHARDPKLPFLMLTGRADVESVVAAKKAGVMGYLVKPVSPQQLRAKVAALDPLAARVGVPDQETASDASACPRKPRVPLNCTRWYDI